jgi:O-antigen/teichoic acid export membrane protein
MPASTPKQDSSLPPEFPTEFPAEFDQELRGKTRRSLGWTVGRALSDQLFSLIIFVILARLLSKEDIGVFAMAYVFAELGRIIATGGLVQIIARAKHIDNRQTDTIFWSNMAIALVFTGLLWLTAPLIGQLLDQPKLVYPLQILSFALPLNALGACHLALRLREFGHKTVALRSILSGIIGGGAAIAAAFSGFGIWSLIIQRCVTEAVGTVLAWTSYRWIPGRAFSWTQAKDNLRFGGNLTIAQLVFLMLVRVQDLLIGNALGAAAVGIYRVAWRSTEIFATAAIQPFSAVGLQTYSRLQSNPAALRQAYISMLGLCSALSFPALVGFGVLSTNLVPLVFGDKWYDAGVLGQVFAFMAIPYTLNYFASPVLTAMGNAHRQRTLAIIQLLLTVTLTVLALPYGLMAVAIAYVIRAYLTMPIQIHFLKEASGIDARATFDAIKAPFVGSTSMGLLLWGVLHYLGDTRGLHWAALTGAIGASAAFYLGLLFTISKTHRQLVMDLLGKKASFSNG